VPRRKTFVLGVATFALGMSLSVAWLTRPFGGMPQETQTSNSSSEPPSSATPADKLQVAPGFSVELLYSVPKATQGSWVCMTFDPKGRLIVSSETSSSSRGRLFRVEVPSLGSDAARTRVEPLQVELSWAQRKIVNARRRLAAHGLLSDDGARALTVHRSMAQGLLCAFDSLYVMVNDAPNPGLYRLRDRDGDDCYDQVELLRRIETSPTSGHGPHAIVLGPDHESLYLVGGNESRPPAPDSTQVPPHWGEDGLLRGLADPIGYYFNDPT
jgi:hypothetical protein